MAITLCAEFQVLSDVLPFPFVPESSLSKFAFSGS